MPRISLRYLTLLTWLLAHATVAATSPAPAKAPATATAVTDPSFDQHQETETDGEPSSDVRRYSVPGGVFVWSLPKGASDVQFRDRPVFVRGNQAYVGIPLKQPLGTARLHYRLDGEVRTHSFEVADKAYTEQHITLSNPEMVNPNPQQLERIRRESQVQQNLYLRFSALTLPDQGFVQPLQGTITSLFGHRRFFNGQPRNPHSGLDIAAPTGTEVRAPAAGQVVLVGDLYYNGKTVFLDHGQGLITMYCHLSAQTVNEGESVNQGQVIGLVGATGRVTGPHLHWSVSLNGYRVDPSVMIQTL